MERRQARFVVVLPALAGMLNTIGWPADSRPRPSTSQRRRHKNTYWESLKMALAAAAPPLPARESERGGRRLRATRGRLRGEGSCDAASRGARLRNPFGLDTSEDDPIPTVKLKAADFFRLGARPTMFVLEGGYTASELGTNAANVAEGFEQV